MVTPYFYGMILATTAATNLPFFYRIIFYSVVNLKFTVIHHISLSDIMLIYKPIEVLICFVPL